MKKKYFTPELEEMELESPNLLVGSVEGETPAEEGLCFTQTCGAHGGGYD
jgi:hypothetical protein